MAEILVPAIGGGPLGPVRPDKDSPTRVPKSENLPGPSFKEVLDGKLSTSKPESAALINDQTELKFSKHAIDRLRSRGIGVDSDLIKSLDRGMVLAKEKGGKDALVITDKGSFILNIPNKTVVTVLGSGKEQVFSNIDSAVIMS